MAETTTRVLLRVNHRFVYDDNDDTELARAIAEQELPPGVSVAEQQEIMMRLLTQRIRCGPTSGEGYNNGTTTTNGIRNNMIIFFNEEYCFTWVCFTGQTCT